MPKITPFLWFDGKAEEATLFYVSIFRNSRVRSNELWGKLTEGGSEEPCGWLKDKYGMSWQVVPSILGTLLGDKDPKKAQGVMTAMCQMKKLDIQALQRAYHQA